MNLINTLFSWFLNHPSVLAWLGAASVFIFLFSMLGISWFIAQIPEDYFLAEKRKSSKMKENNPLLRLFLLCGKNLLGICLIAGGILMIVLPGQGLLTIITGLLLVNYPGKFKLEQKIVSIPSVFRALNWVRVKAKKSPLRKNSFS